MMQTKKDPRGKDMFNKTCFAPPTTRNHRISSIICAPTEDDRALNKITTNALPYRTERHKD